MSNGAVNSRPLVSLCDNYTEKQSSNDLRHIGHTGVNAHPKARPLGTEHRETDTCRASGQTDWRLQQQPDVDINLDPRIFTQRMACQAAAHSSLVCLQLSSPRRRRRKCISDAADVRLLVGDDDQVLLDVGCAS